MYAEPIKSVTTTPATAKRPATPFFQRQVKIGSANDAAEKEADHAADVVLEGKGLTEGKPFFTAAPSPPPIINRKEKNEEEEVQREKKGAGEAVASPQFAGELQNTSGGQPLPDATRQKMESGFGADFSNVRIHNGASAAQLSESINAKAFTHGNNIYFNQGHYQPESRQGQHLLAHELTHTIQQGAAPQKNQTISRKPKHVQRGLLDSAWNAVSDAVSGVTEWASDQLEAGIQWVKDQAAEFVAEIPGYGALCFVLGQDPVSGRGVTRSGLNFLRAILELVPFGSDFERKLTETGTLQEAGTFLDEQVANFDLNLGGILGELGAIWNSLGISDVNNPRGVFQRVANVFTSRVQQVITFASTVSRYFLDLIKRIVIRELAEFVRARTRAYPLMTVALGYDPISEEAVDRSPQNILQAILNLSPNGQQIYEQIVSSGALERIIAYMTSVGMRAMAIAALAKANALAAWAEITIENLLQPVQTFMRIVQLVAEPGIQLLDLITDVVLDFLRMVKDALLGYLGRVAAQVPGFTLLTVILGRNPFTGERVPRTAKKLLQGFFELIPGGESYYQQLLASGAIDRMIAWVTGAVAQFTEIGASIIEAFTTLWTRFSWADLLNPLEAFARVIAVVRRPVDLIIAFVADVVKQLVLVLLQLMNFPIALIEQLIAKISQAIGIIRRDPLGFLRNMLRALRQGFAQFFEKIITHLLHGVSEWLFGQLESAGITPPQEITPQSIFGMVLQILGITVERIWQKIVQKIGPERAARLRRMMDVATGVWAFVKDVMTRGPIAIWEHIQNQLSNLWNLVLDGVRNWVLTKIVQQVTAKLLTMLDPTGIMAVINSFIAIFKAIQTFIEQLTAMLNLLNSLADGVLQMAMGNIAVAADFIERAFARGIPIIISFLANQANLNGLGRRIGEMIGRVRTMVDRAIDHLIDRAWQMGRAVLERAVQTGKNIARAMANWARATHSFVAEDGKSHRVFIDTNRAKPTLMVASTPTTILEFLTYWENKPGISQKKKDIIQTARTHYNSNVAPLLSQVEQSEARNEPEERRAGLLTRLLKQNSIMSMHLRDIMGSKASMAAIKERYALEGTVGRYSSSAEGTGDKLEADHQPQNAVIEHAAGLPSFQNARNMKKRASGRSSLGFAINLHEIRHRKGRTYGRSVAQSFLTAVANIEQENISPAEKRRKVVAEVKEELRMDVATIKAVVAKPVTDAAWADLREPILGLSDADKATFHAELQTRINRGEDQMMRQPLDHLVD